MWHPPTTQPFFEGVFATKHGNMFEATTPYSHRWSKVRWAVPLVQKKLKNRDSDWCWKNPLVIGLGQDTTSHKYTGHEYTIVFVSKGVVVQPGPFGALHISISKVCSNTSEIPIAIHMRSICIDPTLGWYCFVVLCSFSYSFIYQNQVLRLNEVLRSNSRHARHAHLEFQEWDFDYSPS